MCKIKILTVLMLTCDRVRQSRDVTMARQWLVGPCHNKEQ